jgi:type I restriction enzyme S subunit
MPDATLFPTPTPPHAATPHAGAEGAPADSGATATAGPYADLRESGIPWLGRVPKHWRTKPLKHVVAINTDEIAENTDPDHVIQYADIGNVSMLDGITATEEYRFEDAPSRARRRVRNGDTIISTVRTYLKAVARIESPPSNLVVSTGFAVLRPGREVHPGYLYRVVQSEGFVGCVVANSTGVSYPAIAPTILGGIGIPLPPLPEQQAIAGWLDERTRRIDDLVAAKRRLLGLLTEQRTALITHAVTKGLNPATPMKPSGIDWLGDVPRHWEVKRIKFVARVGNGSTPSRENPEYWSGDYPWLNSGVVNQREVTEASDFVTDLALAECHLPIVRPPAVLVGITGEGKTRGMATVLRIEATINQHLSFVKPTRADCDTEYMRFTLHAAYQFLRDESGGGGSTKGAITCDQLGNVSIPFPPHPEQRAIVAHIDAACAKLDVLTATTETAIARLTEYRQALISAAVTGKTNVCGLAGVTILTSEQPVHSSLNERDSETKE